MSDETKQNSARRDFLKMTGTAAAGLVAGTLVSNRAEASTPANVITPEAMPTRNLGRTGHRVGIFSLGGQAAVEQPNNYDTAQAIVERALDLGVNYVDTAAAYGGKERWSQKYIGQVMKRRRKEAFLASKTNDRTYDGSLKLLEESLTLLNTDHLDLWQLHNLSRMEEVERIFAKGGAFEALMKAREQKMVRFLGVTGHADPDVLLEAMRRFQFDTVLMSLNAADRHHMSFTAKLLPTAVERQMGIIGMKIPARGRILAQPNPQGAYYKSQKQPGTINIRDAMYYTLSHPVSTVIIGCDSVAQVEENVRLAREFTPLSDNQLATLAEKTQPIAKEALFFRPWV